MAAVRNRTAMVLVIGEIPPGEKNKLQSMDQRRFVEACSTRYLHHHQAGQCRRGDRRGVLYGARAALPGGAQSADGHPGALVRLGLRVSPLDRVPAEGQRCRERRGARADRRSADARRAADHHRGPRRAQRRRQGRDRRACGSRRRAARDLAAGQGPVRRTRLRHRHRGRLRERAERAAVRGCGLRARRRRRAWLLHHRRRPAVSRRRSRAHRHRARADRAWHSPRPLCARRCAEDREVDQRDASGAQGAEGRLSHRRDARGARHRRRAGREGDRRARSAPCCCSSIGRALPRNALVTCGAGHFLGFVAMHLAAAGRRRHAVLAPVRRGRPDAARRVRDRRRASGAARISSSRATAA